MMQDIKPIRKNTDLWNAWVAKHATDGTRVPVTHVYNMQAVQVKGNNWGNWRIWFQNQSQFRYLNDKFNGKAMVEPSAEKLDGMKGQY